MTAIDWPAVLGTVLWIGLASVAGVLWTLTYVACRWLVLVST